MAFLVFCAKEGAEKASDAMLPERVADATYHEVEVLLMGEEEKALRRKELALLEKGLLTRFEFFSHLCYNESATFSLC